MNPDPYIIHRNFPEMDHRCKWLKEIIQAENK